MGFNDYWGHISTYADIQDVQVLVTPAQRRRGVGTVVLVRHLDNPEDPNSTVLIRNVPEPERLAEWIRSKQSGPP
jgi:hypothetical protein